MTRNDGCPLCRMETEFILQLQFSSKMRLPTVAEIRYCPADNFLFVAAGSQNDYDEYYTSVANDSYHKEVSGGTARSVISEVQQIHVLKVLRGFFAQPRQVLDFGCGEASLLLELASQFPSSSFVGFEPSPAREVGKVRATALGLDNLQIADFQQCVDLGPFDLIIVSHVAEHLLDFDLLDTLRGFLRKDGLLYAEVPNALQYPSFERREFLYYFDRLHVNHFTPQALARLVAQHGFGLVEHFEFSFPYRDGGNYPALGMLFGNGKPVAEILSPDIASIAKRYIAQEKQKAAEQAQRFGEFDNFLVWGAGDNFFRSSENDGPISTLRNLVLLDRSPREVEIGDRRYNTVDPAMGIQQHSWPIIVTVSAGRKSIGDEIRRLDPGRQVFYI